jgi:hypothetical protein
MEMQAGHGDFFARPSEAGLDATLVRLNGIDALDKPEDDYNAEYDHEDATVESTGQKALQTILATPDDVFQIWRPAASARSVRSLPPRSTLIVPPAAAPWAAAILIAPRHQDLFVDNTPHAFACGNRQAAAIVTVIGIGA